MARVGKFELELLTDSTQNETLQEDLDKGTDGSETNVPDGGLRAWLVVLASFSCYGIIFAVINSYGVLYPEIVSNLKEDNISEASGKAALVGSLTLGTTFCVSLVSGIISDRIGIRGTTLIGSSLATMGLFCSSFVSNSVEALYVTYGIMFGVGAALVLTPSINILNQYFHKYLGLTNGIVASGNAVFTIVLTFVVDKLLKLANLQKTLWLLTAFAACMMLCAVLFTPLSSKVKPKKKQSSFRGLINVSIWKNKRYLIWNTVLAFSLFGYFVPYVHMKKFAEETFPGYDGNLLIMCISIASCLGRLVFGYIADLPKVDRILLQQSSFLIIGTVTMCLPFCPSFTWLLIGTLVIGLFDGCFTALLGPITVDICGTEGTAQGLGYLFGFASIPMTIGPPVAGMLYDRTRSYQLPFLLSGVPLITGFIAMFLIKCVRNSTFVHQVE